MTRFDRLTELIGRFGWPGSPAGASLKTAGRADGAGKAEASTGQAGFSRDLIGMNTVKIESSDFKDLFSGHAEKYAASRPDYPPEVFEFISDVCDHHELAIDCAAGNGQAARGLLPLFSSVLMLDASLRQLSQSPALRQGNPEVQGTVGLAEAMPLESGIASLIVVAQAMHWFRLGGFFSESDRILKRGGVLACLGYARHRIGPDCDAIVDELYEETLEDYWPPERRLVETCYSGIDFPFNAVSTPAFQLEKRWTIGQVLAYLYSWSAVQSFIRLRGQDPVARIESRLRRAFGKAPRRSVQWELTLIVRKKV